MLWFTPSIGLCIYRGCSFRKTPEPEDAVEETVVTEAEEAEEETVVMLSDEKIAE